MIQHTYQSLVYFTFENLETQSGLRHFVSSRQGGFSEAPFDSLNISLKNDKHGNVLQNRALLAEAIDISMESFCFAQQVHGNFVQVIEDNDRGRGLFAHSEGIPNTDAMVTQKSDICLVVASADCVPLLFFDPQKKVIGAAHAGWRGTVQKIAQATIETMQTRFDANPEHILVGIGPCISAAVYEVGADVEEAVAESFGATEGYLIENAQTGKKHLDLVYSNLQQLLSKGVLPQNIELSGLCTYQRSDLFFSYRKQKGTVGIFGSGIMMEA